MDREYENDCKENVRCGTISLLGLCIPFLLVARATPLVGTLEYIKDDTEPTSNVVGTRRMPAKCLLLVTLFSA